MNRSRRRFHAISWFVFAGLIPTMVVLALLARPPLIPPVPTEVFRQASSDLGELEVELSATEVSIRSSAPPSSPDLLLYWSGFPVDVADTHSWILLGPVAAGQLRLPEAAVEGGALVLYSLAKAEIIDTLIIDHAGHSGELGQ